MNKITNTTWVRLTPVPFTLNESLTPPIFININEFIVFTSKHAYWNEGGIIKYNINTNVWTKLLEYDKDDEFIYGDSAVYHSQSKMIYISCHNHKIFKYDVSKMKSISITDTRVIDYNSRLLLIDNKLHNIGGERGHWIWNIQTDKISEKGKQVKKIVNDHQHALWRQNLYDPAVIYLKSQQCILLFGGRGSYWRRSVHRFSISDNTWNKLDCKLPRSMNSCGIVKTRNERFIILFGGNISNVKNSDDIYIYDVRNNEVVKSEIKAPMSGCFRASVTDYPERDNKLCFGFVRDAYNDEDFIDLQKLPLYLMDFISKWYQHQEIYLLEISAGGHWRINLDEILHHILR